MQPRPHGAPCPTALLYLFVLHDHDRSGRLDGLELLQLLGTVLAQRDGGRPDPDVVGPTGTALAPHGAPGPGPHPVPTLSPQVAALVDRALEQQDLSGDGLLDPPELLLSPGRGQGPPGQPLLQPPGEPLAGAGAVPGGHAEVSGPVQGLAEGQAAPQAGAIEAEEAPEGEAPDVGAMEAEEAPPG
ncbi:PREDICTED: cell growth regulator with EF hand domain protein 1 [Nipponia nippon]|uniref:cell growth regulator with EF hand domain protein 1 n=1 Tax=Nipponia nippon TaxID=128390 RepID=UPI0005115343|nr:PREDICTED: cell growth regulator with EF hand domain protein 1 [Nipponia nippon]